MKSYVVRAEIEVEAETEVDAEFMVMNMDCVDPETDEVLQSPYIEITEVKELS
jgi:hypothetical protein